MEKYFNIGVMNLKLYRKPVAVSANTAHGLIPAAAVIAGLSAAKLAVVGVAAGLAAGASSSRGSNHINSGRTMTLTKRKNNFAV